MSDNFAAGMNFSQSHPAVNGSLGMPSETPFLNLGIDTDEYGMPRNDYRPLHMGMLPVMPEAEPQTSTSGPPDVFNPNDFSNKIYSQMASRRRKRGGQLTLANHSSERGMANGTSEYDNGNGYAEDYEPDDAMYNVNV